MEAKENFLYLTQYLVCVVSSAVDVDVPGRIIGYANVMWLCD